MKDVKNLGIKASETAVQMYNELEDLTPTNFFEAKRTLEAIRRVRTNETLIKNIREEAKNAESEV